jgi:hypothetical protein
MSPATTDRSVIVGLNVAEYFNGCVTAALSHQKVAAGAETVFYIVNLLTYYTRAENLFAGSEPRTVCQPLALIYAQAVEATTPEARQASLKQLGDMALVVAGLFSASLSRKLVDVDYYIAMGGAAYGFLADNATGSTRGKVFAAVFGELSVKFQAFVDVLGEVSENSSLGSHPDVMRLYEIWLKTGSKRAADKLRELGVEPIRPASARRSQ